MVSVGDLEPTQEFAAKEAREHEEKGGKKKLR